MDSWDKSKSDRPLLITPSPSEDSSVESEPEELEDDGSLSTRFSLFDAGAASDEDEDSSTLNRFIMFPTENDCNFESLMLKSYIIKLGL